MILFGRWYVRMEREDEMHLQVVLVLSNGYSKGHSNIARLGVTALGVLILPITRSIEVKLRYSSRITHALLKIQILGLPFILHRAYSSSNSPRLFTDTN